VSGQARAARSGTDPDASREPSTHGDRVRCPGKVRPVGGSAPTRHGQLRAELRSRPWRTRPGWR